MSKIVGSFIAVSMLAVTSSTALAVWHSYHVNVPSFGGNTTIVYQSAEGIYQEVATSSIGGSYNGDIYANITHDGKTHLATANQPLYSGTSAYFTSPNVYVGESISPLWWTSWWIPVTVGTTGQWRSYK